MRAINRDGGLSEAAWQSQVFGLLRFYGWRFHHSPDNRPAVAGAGRRGRQHVGDAGFPDIVATRHLPGYESELLFVELKTDKGRYRPGQWEWLGALERVGRGVRDLAEEAELAENDPRAPAIGVFTWRPRDRDRVDRMLAGPDGPGVMVLADELACHNPWSP